MKSDQIKIKNVADGVTTIDIEGVIGMPEECQFEQPETRVATYQKFKDTVARIAQIQTPEVVVNIRSTGGDVEDALLIYDALRALNARVTTRCAGYVASAATVIAQAASKGCREIVPEALYLIHRSAMAAEGDAQTMRHNAELLEKTDRRIAEIYAECSGRNAEEFLSLMNENGGTGCWMTADEALAAGLVDSIVQSEQRSGWAAKVRAWVDKVVGRQSHGQRVALPPTDSLRSTMRPIRRQTESDHQVELLRCGQQRVDRTELKAVEDPAIHDIKKTFNQESYSRDAMNFR
ncbi:MAG: Clp protease ClpP [Rikenellaceae bacterium]|nr:Clp protease ClpP [Rikenellaceae bacterium]